MDEMDIPPKRSGTMIINDSFRDSAPSIPLASIFVAAMLLAACAPTLVPVGTGARHAVPMAMVLDQQYIRHRVGTGLYPAGRYAAAFSDHQDTYYMSPTKIAWTLIGGSELRDGGFYVPYDGAAIYPFYVDDNNAPT